ncbi:MAG: hypothetical protein HN741_11955, partial [Anaerolineae bacterium]|nr:hypothetical protein [Anaerolineae bacterium]
MRKNNIFSQHLFFTRADIYFWLLFILLNGFLFLPDLLFTAPKTRYSLNIEILIAFIIWIIFSTRCGEKARRLFWGIFLAFIYIALIYKSYASILIGFYQMEPNFYNDLPFIANGLPFLLDS